MSDEIARVDDISLTTIIAKTAFSLPSVCPSNKPIHAINAIRGEFLLNRNLHFPRALRG